MQRTTYYESVNYPKVDINNIIVVVSLACMPRARMGFVEEKLTRLRDLMYIQQFSVKALWSSIAKCIIYSVTIMFN